MPLPTPHLPKTENDTLRARAEALHLHGLLTHWSEVVTQPWLAPMLDWEEQQRARRSLERRLSAAHIGRFKPLCDFDWTWPKQCDRGAVDALITLDFLKEAANVVFVGPNGVGKSMFAQNIAHQAVIDGHTVLSAGRLLRDSVSVPLSGSCRWGSFCAVAGPHAGRALARPE
jgi:DNA replication protein DnaC